VFGGGVSLYLMVMYSMVPTTTMVGPELLVPVDGAADRYWGGEQSCSVHITHVNGEQGRSKSPYKTNIG
jgi:hypothetical protein